MSTPALIRALSDDQKTCGQEDSVQDDLFFDASDQKARWGGDAVQWSGRGRKPGAKNRATQDVLRYCEAMFGHPLVRLAAFAGGNTDDIAKRLECTKAQAFDRQMAVDRILTEFYKKTLGDVLDNALNNGGISTVNFGLLLGLEGEQNSTIADNRSNVLRAGHEFEKSKNNQELSGLEND